MARKGRTWLPLQVVIAVLIVGCGTIGVVGQSAFAGPEATTALTVQNLVSGTYAGSVSVYVECGGGRFWPLTMEPNEAVLLEVEAGEPCFVSVTQRNFESCPDADGLFRGWCSRDHSFEISINGDPTHEAEIDITTEHLIVIEQMTAEREPVAVQSLTVSIEEDAFSTLELGCEIEGDLYRVRVTFPGGQWPNVSVRATDPLELDIPVGAECSIREVDTALPDDALPLATVIEGPGVGTSVSSFVMDSDVTVIFAEPWQHLNVVVTSESSSLEVDAVDVVVVHDVFNTGNFLLARHGDVLEGTGRAFTVYVPDFMFSVACVDDATGESVVAPRVLLPPDPLAKDLRGTPATFEFGPEVSITCTFNVSLAPTMTTTTTPDLSATTSDADSLTTTPQGSTLPPTGLDASAPAVSGLMFLALGGTLVVASRRRRAATKARTSRA